MDTTTQMLLHEARPTTERTVKLLLSPDEAAEMLSISRSLLYRLLMHKRIFSVKLGGARRIPIKALRDYVDDLCQGETVR